MSLLFTLTVTGYLDTKLGEELLMSFKLRESSYYPFAWFLSKESLFSLERLSKASF